MPARKKKKRTAKPAVVRDRHLLYSAAVQSVDADLDFFTRIWRRQRGGRFERLREDFCGTAVLACAWVRRGKQNRAWGVDRDRKTLDWGRRRYVSTLGPASERLELLCQDVLRANGPRVDVVAALNFSYYVFQTRDLLRKYFRRVHDSLGRDGIFFLDVFGGTDTLCECEDRRRIATDEAFDGTKVPGFTYVWEQARFNPVDHAMRCHIHFELRDGTRLDRAFTYDWRFWTIPEVREVLAEVGFRSSEVYIEGWDDEEDEPDGIFRRRARFDNEASWIGYVVAYR
jgi:hypothetical protein